LAEGLSGLTGFQITRWFGDGFRAREPEAVAHCVAVFLANATRAYAETCRMLGAADLRSVLPRISVPAAIMVGEEDYATPLAMAQNLHAAIVGSTLEVLPRYAFAHAGFIAWPIVLPSPASSCRR
jgi:3-oxoadipate enol-lactonase